MPRNKKPRFIGHRPPVSVFKPAGVPARTLQWVRLALDEYEAVRLADGEGLSQEEVALRLGVSRPTVSRILESARRKIARTLSEGQALAIEGGPVQFVPPAPFPGRGRGRGRRGGAGGAEEDRAMGAGQGRGTGAGGGRGGGRGRGGGFALGPGGNCVCPNCSTKASHPRGTPCYQTSCPKCGAKMTRER